MYRKIILFIPIILAICILPGCSKSNLKTSSLSGRYGVIETTSQENKTYLSFYNDDFEKLGEETIKYGSMGDGFSLPIVFNNSMFIVPKGIYNTKELTFIMEYDFHKGKIKKHDTGLQNMNNITIDDDYVYGVNTMNLVSNIVKCNRETKKVSKIEIPEVYISYITIYGNELFAFGEKDGGDELESYLYILDSNTLDILNKIDITNIGFGQYYTVMKDNKLYFPTSYSMEDEGNQPINKLSEYNRASGEFKTYDLKENFPFQIMEYKDKLLITHFDPVGVEGNKISLFNPDDGSSEIIELKHNVEQLDLDGEEIIILGNGYLYRYNKDFLLIDDVKVFNDRDTEYNYYTTGIFKM